MLNSSWRTLVFLTIFVAQSNVAGLTVNVATVHTQIFQSTSLVNFHQGFLLQGFHKN